MDQSNYPKWVQRAPDIGAVLCRNAAEEEKLMADWHAEQEGKARAEAEAAEAAAAEAKAQAELTLKTTVPQAVGGDMNAGKGKK